MQRTLSVIDGTNLVASRTRSDFLGGISVLSANHSYAQTLLFASYFAKATITSGNPHAP